MHARDKQKKTPGADVLSSKKKLQKSDRPAEGGVQTPPPPALIRPSYKLVFNHQAFLQLLVFDNDV